MPFESNAVANEFLRLAWSEGRDITPMQLVKLVYIAHGWSLALNDEPLIREEVQAWKFGPVVPEVYREFKEFGKEPVTTLAQEFVRPGKLVPYEIWDAFDDSDIQAKELVNRVWDSYKERSGVQLSAITHQPNTPWADITKNGTEVGMSKEIPNELIKKHYQELAQKRNVT
jgi:uncharacterized phage-associated protein